MIFGFISRISFPALSMIQNFCRKFGPRIWRSVPYCPRTALGDESRQRSIAERYSTEYFEAYAPPLVSDYNGPERRAIQIGARQITNLDLAGMNDALAYLDAVAATSSLYFGKTESKQ
jgi:hypothetical protein